MDKHINDLCREQRDKLQLTNHHIAERSGVPISTVNNYFSAASKNPGVNTAGPICAVLNVSLDQFYNIDQFADTRSTKQIEYILDHAKIARDEAERALQAAENAKQDAERLRGTVRQLRAAVIVAGAALAVMALALVGII